MNVCFESISSLFIGGSQNGWDVVVADDVRSMILVFIFSSRFIDDVEVAIHSSEVVTSEILGRGIDAYCRHSVSDV